MKPQSMRLICYPQPAEGNRKVASEDLGSISLVSSIITVFVCVRDQNNKISDELGGFLRISKAAPHAQNKLRDSDSRAKPVCNGRLLLPAAVWEAQLYTCFLLGNICAHNGKGGGNQRLTVKSDRKRCRQAIRRWTPPPSSWWPCPNVCFILYRVLFFSSSQILSVSCTSRCMYVLHGERRAVSKYSHKGKKITLN